MGNIKNINMESFVFQKESKVFYVTCFVGYLITIGLSLIAVSSSLETMSMLFHPLSLFLYLILFIFFTYFAVKGIATASMSSILTMFLSAFSLALMLYSLYQFMTV